MNVLLLANSPSILFVIGLGLGTVFVGLICIILICYITGMVVRLFDKPKAAEAATAPVMTGADPSVTNRGAFIAAVSAAIAEESGTDASGIRIVSVKKL